MDEEEEEETAHVALRAQRRFLAKILISRLAARQKEQSSPSNAIELRRIKLTSLIVMMETCLPFVSYTSLKRYPKTEGGEKGISQLYPTMVIGL